MSVYSGIYSQEVEIKFNSNGLGMLSTGKIRRCRTNILVLNGENATKTTVSLVFFYIDNRAIFAPISFPYSVNFYAKICDTEKKSCALRLRGADLSCTCLNRHVA